MMQWGVQEMARQRHRDLVEQARGARNPAAGRSAEAATLRVVKPPVTGHAASAVPARGRRPVRPLGHHLGALLIRAGTRLGGASVRTS